MVSIAKNALNIARERGLWYLIKYVLAIIDYKVGLISLLLAPFIVHRVKSLNLENTLRLLFSNSFLGMLFKPMQIEEEISEFLKIAKKLKPKYILEIGTAHGGTLLLFTRISSSNAVIISMDLPGGPFGGGYPWLRKLIYSTFKRGEQKIIFIRSDSHKKETVEKVKEVLGGNMLDILFIDGDHSYEGVRKDYEMYSNLVREGGIIAFHDINPGPPYLVGGVSKFWNEIKRVQSRYSNIVEIIDDRRREGYGIGVIIK